MLRVLGVRGSGVGRGLRKFGSFYGIRTEYGRALSGFGAPPTDLSRGDGGLLRVEWLDSRKLGGARRSSSARPQPEPDKSSGEKDVAENSTKDLLKTAAGLTKTERRDLVLSPPALVVTREYEWGNILIGFEQVRFFLETFLRLAYFMGAASLGMLPHAVRGQRSLAASFFIMYEEAEASRDSLL